jgi:rare lipoprotein A (peptidoglycan hydrolase)
MTPYRRSFPRTRERLRQSNNKNAAVPKACPNGTAANTSGAPDYSGGATEYGVDRNGNPLKFAYQQTASGTSFDPWGFTAATQFAPPGQRWTIPKNSYIDVISPRYGTNVVVQITDTGALGTGDVIDLSAAGMQALTGHAFDQTQVNIYRFTPHQ